MRKIAITLMSIILFSNISKAQQYENYSGFWKEIQELETKALPKSALKVVETIYKKAKEEDNSAQITKALLYKSKFALTLEEDAQLNIINSFKNEIKLANTPTKNVLESVLANLYWQYFQQNRYKFYKRTKVVSEGLEDTNFDTSRNSVSDFRTWDLETLFYEVHTHFQNSLQNGLLLQQTDLDKFNDILHLQKGSKKYRPTLYDFIAHNALTFYKTNETSITKPSYKFEVSVQDFKRNYELKTDIYETENDSLSLQLNALKIYQNLISLHHNNKNSNAFVSVELERLKFVKLNAHFSTIDSIYFNQLKKLKSEFKTHEASTLVDFEIATIYKNEANNYNSKTAKEHQFKNAKALDICKKALDKFPESLGAKKCTNLIASILQPTLNLTTEKHIPSNKPSKFLIRYKNIDKLFTTIYNIDDSQIIAFNKIYDNTDKVDFIQKLSQENAFQNILKNEIDYQQHSTEIVIPALKNGKFLIVSSPTKKLNKEAIYATTIVQGTNISIVQKNDNEQHIYQVIDRNTGKPYNNADISVKNYNTGRYNKSISKKLTTNELGEFRFKTNSYHRNVIISVETNNEKASFGNYYLNENRRPKAEINEGENIKIKPFIFTDRSIYRPGQTVHFKAIFIEKAGDKSTPYNNESVTASLYNVNNEKIKEIDLNTNEFGSTSGNFVLPNNGLLGNYHLQLSTKGNFNENHYFSVEEYKRPKFETEFKPITETFKVNDSVTVKGSAIAFAGSTITNGKVTYRVHRKVVYPRWFYWYRPSFNASEAMEITHGETTTDTKGNFEITFKAIPDKSVDEDNKPIFTYEIEADVTDINGETRSATTTVKVGYHMLTIATTINEQIDNSEKNHKIGLKSTNLNGEFVATKGVLKIYKLQAPQNVLRTRPWNAPDYQEISKEKYAALFPHEPYTNEDNNISNWKKGNQVFESEFNTEVNKEITLKKIKNWKVGNYIIEVEAKDKYNQLVEDKQRFKVFNSKKPQIADKQLFKISTDKNTYKPNEVVKLTLGSASNDMVITIAIEKNHEIVSQQIINLNNEVKSINIPVSKKDLGGFAIKYSFSNYNEFRSGTVQIPVPHAINDLQIETQTFRDKLQPGQDETWSFKIKGENTDKVTAEILASMYDVSLDEFKSHSWNFNPIQHTSYYSYNNWNSQNSYGNTNFRVTNLPRNYYQNYTQKYDQLNWFGFRFGNNSTIRIRGMAAMKSKGIEVAEDAMEIEEMAMVATDSLDEVVVTEYAEKKEEITEPEKLDLSGIKIRKNFNETAFFFPHLKTDKDGNVSFNFTIPEALTRWKLQLLAHTKELATATQTLTTITQKKLMVLPNPPRFLREGDVLQFSSKISNLSDKILNGVAQLVLTDAVTGEEITDKLVSESLENTNQKKASRTSASNTQNFMVDAKGNSNIKWTLNIPEGIQAVQYKIVAKAGEFSDGEQNVLPILSNRMLVTETLPMWVRSNQTKTFTLDKLINTSKKVSSRTSDTNSALKNQTSTTLSHHKLTLEITSNPAWYAIQSLPYLMEYPYECAEQTFSRYYANTLASHIANSNPRIQEVFNLWKTSDVSTGSTTALVSNLEKNEELKSIIIQETPWLRDAQNETEQKKRIGLLFDLNKMKNEQEIALNKLKELQFSNGGFPWFKGSKYPNRYITQHIASSYGHLKHLNVVENSETEKMIIKAVKFLDDEILNDYNKLLKEAKKIRDKAKTKTKGIKAEKEYLEKNHLSHTQLHYLYMRSFYSEIEIPSKVKTAVDHYTNQSVTYWTDYNLYSKGMIALIQHRNNNSTVTSEILKSLKENSITSQELGMYWKENTPSWFWYQSPIETHALLIEVFSEVGSVIQSETKNLETIDNLKVWLLKNKQTNQWKTTKATTEAVYALLLQGSDWLTASTERSRSVNESVEVTVGTQKIAPSKLENVQVEAGTGYYKTSWNGNEITPEMGTITISKKDDGIAWGGLYWQYFEDLDKITSAETPLQLSKKLFLKSNTATGKELTEITETSNLKVGDLITVRVELKVDRPMEFVHMKDMRASGLEPINVLSNYKWQDGLGYYESTKDASTNFFMERLPKGVYVFEYDLRVNNAGNFSNGITTIQSMYAPEFSSHSEGVRIEVRD